MSTLKVLSVMVLSCLAGILAGFGASGVSQRSADAAPLINGTKPVAPVTSAGQPTSGPGSDFVTRIYKADRGAVVHVTNTSSRSYLDFFRGPVEVPIQGTGSGVIIDSSGFILTNAHVVENAKQISVTLSDGGQYPATVTGVDRMTDLALIRISAGKSLPSIPLGDSSKVEVGEWVVAIGNPLGQDWTVTCGIISALNRQGPAWQPQQQGEAVPTLSGLIQTDAAINPGNSGGPLLNARGEVVGINERILSQSGGNVGIAMAVPINTAKSILSDLKQYGRVPRPWLGISVLGEVSPPAARQLNLPVNYGLVIGRVAATGPAAHAGIVAATEDQVGNYQFEVVTQVDGRSIKTQQELLDLVRNRKQGDVLHLTVYRITNGQSSAQTSVAVSLAAMSGEAEHTGFI